MPALRRLSGGIDPKPVRAARLGLTDVGQEGGFESRAPPVYVYPSCVYLAEWDSLDTEAYASDSST